MKTCARCKTIKPTSSFGPKKGMNDGLNSWCRECANAVNREWKRQHPNYQQAVHEIAKGPRTDPAAYTKMVCDHIADVLATAINRFERKAGKEAPPHLTAIMELANQISEQQQPLPRKTNRTCGYCGNTYTVDKYATMRRWCSNKCKERFKAAQRTHLERLIRASEPPPPPRPPTKTERERQERKERHEKLKPIREALALTKDIEADLVTIYRLHGVKWQDIANTFGYPNPGSVYALANYRPKATST